MEDGLWRRDYDVKGCGCKDDGRMIMVLWYDYDVNAMFSFKRYAIWYNFLLSVCFWSCPIHTVRCLMSFPTLYHETYEWHQKRWDCISWTLFQYECHARTDVEWNDTQMISCDEFNLQKNEGIMKSKKKVRYPTVRQSGESGKGGGWWRDLEKHNKQVKYWWRKWWLQ